MQSAAREYDAKIDENERLTLRGAFYEHYHVSEDDDGRSLEPRDLSAPFQVSANTLAMMGGGPEQEERLRQQALFWVKAPSEP